MHIAARGLARFGGRLSGLLLSDPGQLFRTHLPLELLEGVDARRRAWPALRTATAFLRQVLSPGQPCREAVRAGNAARAAARQALVSDSSSAYCQARRRLPEEVLASWWRHLAGRMAGTLPRRRLWKGLRVGVVDGTGLSMPDTPSNQKRYPQPSQQKPGCGFPVVKIVGVFSLLTGALHGFAKGTLAVHERILFHELWPAIAAGFDVLVGDRGFCSFGDMFLLRQAGVDTVFRLHQRRRVDWRSGRRLGRRDRLAAWDKPPSRPEWMTQAQYASLPAVWTVRLVELRIAVPGFRTRSVLVATTLLDSRAFSAADIAQLYAMRWSVELCLRHIKTTMRMDVLRCLSPEMIHREIHMHWIAYNLVRTLMGEAALPGRLPVARISYKGTLDTLRHWLPVLHGVAPQPRRFSRLRRQMLEAIAGDPVPERPHRSEPRAVKRRPKKFHLLNRPRHQMGNLPHRNAPAGKPSSLT